MLNKKFLSVLTASLLVAGLMTGCGDEDVSVDDTSEEEYVEEESSSDASVFDGWWVVSPNYYEDAVPIVSAFSVDSAAEEWTRYDELGNATDTFSCSFPDEESIVMEMDALGPIELYIDGDILYYVDDDHEAFVRSDGPDFVSMGDYSGTWYLNNDPDRGIYYELTEDHASKYEDGSVVLEDDYSASASTVSFPNETLDTPLPCLEMEFPNPTFYPGADDNVLIEKDTFRNNIYVREGTELPADYTSTLDMLVNSSFYPAENADPESSLRLAFNPDFSFIIMTMTENGQDTSAGETVGTWSLGTDFLLHLTYNDGTEEEVNLANWNQEIALENPGTNFVMDFYMPE